MMTSYADRIAKGQFPVLPWTW